MILISGMECPENCVDADGNTDCFLLNENRLPATFYPLIRGTMPIAKVMLEKYQNLNKCAYSDVSVLRLCKSYVGFFTSLCSITLALNLNLPHKSCIGIGIGIGIDLGLVLVLVFTLVFMLV